MTTVHTNWLQAKAAHRAEMLATYGDTPDLQYADKRGAEGSALRAAWLAEVAADNAYHHQFAARAA